MPVLATSADSTRAAQLLAEMGAGCIITLGGDGTNRAVARGCGAVPLVWISMRTAPTIEGIRAELTHFFAHSGLVRQALVEQLYQQRIQPGAREALLATAEAAFGGNQQRIDLREILPSLPNEILVVWGNAYSVIPVAHAQQAHYIPKSKVEIIEECGHCPHIERAGAFNQLAMSFLGA